MMIYNKIFIVFYIFLFLAANQSLAAKSGYIDYNSVLFDYSKLNYQEIQREADGYFSQYERNKDSVNKFTYLDNAAGKYYILTKVDNTRIEPYVQLARIYDEKNKQRLAKEYFCKAINLNINDPAANFYFGEFFFKRCRYKNALYYYKTAYKNGYKNNFLINLRLATIYEKFGDLVNAKKFYDVSYSMRPDKKLQRKINSLNKTNYEKSEYYNQGVENETL